LEVDFRTAELKRVELSITDWAFKAEGAAIVKKRLEQHELYRQTGNLCDLGYTGASLHLEQLRTKDLKEYSRLRAQLQEKVMEARYVDMEPKQAFDCM